jgi:hypothetical protein
MQYLPACPVPSALVNWYWGMPRRADNRCALTAFILFSKFGLSQPFCHSERSEESPSTLCSKYNSLAIRIFCFDELKRPLLKAAALRQINNTDSFLAASFD